MRRIFLAFALLLAPAAAEAATRYNSGPGLCAAGTGSGCWNDATATWSATSCTDTTYVAAPTSSDDVRLCPGKTVTVPCGTNAVLKTLADDASWTASDTGGLVADGSACPAGQVPTFTFYSTASTASAKFERMGALATFTLAGRSVTTDAPWGEALDLTDNCGGSDKTANGVTWETAKNECSKYTWANKPYSASVPTGLSGLSLGNLVWFTSGLYRNNWATVTASTSTTLTIGYGDPDDGFGTQSSMPAITGSSSTSLEVPMDVTLTAWDTTNPTRIVASIQSGGLSALPGAANGTGQRAGWCLVTSTATTPAGSGRFYRIAGSVDGGGGVDSLILDPWDSVAPADRDAGFLAVGANAWIAPCVKPGDRWYSFEPVVWKPATAGTNQSSMAFFAGMCPTLTRVYNPNATAAEDGAGAWSDLTKPAFGFYGQSGCTIAGPWAIGPMREVASVQGYVVGIKATNGFTISNTSLQGSYWYSSPSNTVWHGFTYLDSAGLVFDRVNVSFINNEAFYLHQQTEEVSDSDSTFEGMSLTIKNSTVHDVFHKFGLADSGSAIDITGNTHTSGVYTYDIHDNIIYNVVRSGIQGKNGSMPFSANIYSNVIGTIHRESEVDTNTSRTMQFGNGATNGFNPNTYVVNNVLLSTIDYNLTTATSTYGVMNANTAYNYIGEHGVGVDAAAGATSDQWHYGDLIHAAGSASSTGVLTTSTMQYGYQLRRNDSNTGSLIVRDLTVQRLCSLMPIYFAGIVFNSSVIPSVSMDMHFTHNTFGLYCPEAAAATSVAGSAGIATASRNFISMLSPTSEISNNIFVTGDNTVSATWKPFPITLSSGLSSTTDGLVGNTSFTTGKNLCSRCDDGGSTCGTLASARECCRNCDNGAGNPYTHNQTGVNLERLTPALQMESLGIFSASDLRLTPGSKAYSFAEDSDHIGSRYSGIVNYSQAMADAGIPMNWLYYRADGDDEPDRSVIPAALRFLIRSGGSTGRLPKAF